MAPKHKNSAWWASALPQGRTPMYMGSQGDTQIANPQCWPTVHGATEAKS
jgi:hypothetical protein